MPSLPVAASIFGGFFTTENYIIENSMVWWLLKKRPAGESLPVSMDDRVNVSALREITDDSGGRTEIVRSTRDLNPATAGIADELSRQYYLGYPASGPKDGKWHAIRVETRNAGYHVRARRGFVATP